MLSIATIFTVDLAPAPKQWGLAVGLRTKGSLEEHNNNNAFDSRLMMMRGISPESKNF